MRAQEHDGELTVVATGPLTNIALACKIDERFPQKGGRGGRNQARQAACSSG